MKTMGKVTLEEFNKLPRIEKDEMPEVGFWPHQQKVIQAGNTFLNRDPGNRTFLIRMPTGTGKSGVIGYFASCLSKYRNVLILTPWKNLRDQLIRNLMVVKTNPPEFWGRIGYQPSFDKNHILIKPINVNLIKSELNNYILFSTITSIQRISSEARFQGKIKILKELIDLIIVDEGHYEPATTWATSIREFQKPIILLTATPYRNDYKVFQVQDDHIEDYKHEEAEQSGIITKVKIVDSEADPYEKDYHKSLIKNFLEYFQGLCENIEEYKTCKIIVHCETAEQVEKVAKELIICNESVIGIHETFDKRPEKYLKKDVPPNHKEEPYRFWVHQRKLIEGIDDPKFKVLILYSTFRNQRALIQQIGRILRSSEGKGQPAIVFAPSVFKIKKYWDAYRIFELNPTIRNRDTLKALEELIKHQPSTEYIGNKFRNLFNFKEKNPEDALNYRLSVNIYQKSKLFNVTKFLNGVKAELEEKDRIVVTDIGLKRGMNPVVVVYVWHGNCPHLLDQSLMEFRLGYVVIYFKDSFIFFYDSEGIYSTDYLNKYTIPLDNKYLRNVIPYENTVPKEMSLRNALLGSEVLRSQIIRGENILNTPGSLIDNLNICYTINARVPKIQLKKDSAELMRTIRYLGFSRSKISDSATSAETFDGVSISDLEKWYNALYELIQSGRDNSNKVFRRYAPPVTPPKQVIPKFIQFDISPIDYEIFDNFRQGSPIMVPEPSLEILSTKSMFYFNLRIHDDQGDDDIGSDSNNNHLEGEIHKPKEFKIKISYARNQRKFILDCDRMNHIHIKSKNEDEVGRFIKFLNDKQLFTISLQDYKTIYKDKQFFEIKYNLFTDLIDNISLIENLSQTKLECHFNKDGHEEERVKNPVLEESWPKDSIFHLLDIRNLNSPFKDNYKDIDYFICDDMGGELADFIGISKSSKKIILIHAKQGTTAELSPEPFQVVCSQAKKSLSFIAPNPTSDPNRIEEWHNGFWQYRGHQIERLRRGELKTKGSSEELWVWVKDNIINNQNSTKEIWIVLGNISFRDELKSNLEIDPTNYKYGQLVFLLNSTWGVIGQHAKLRIFC